MCKLLDDPSILAIILPKLLALGSAVLLILLRAEIMGFAWSIHSLAVFEGLKV
jgi:hypothetical protein